MLMVMSQKLTTWLLGAVVVLSVGYLIFTLARTGSSTTTVTPTTTTTTQTTTGTTTHPKTATTPTSGATSHLSSKPTSARTIKSMTPVSSGTPTQPTSTTPLEACAIAPGVPKIYANAVNAWIRNSPVGTQTVLTDAQKFSSSRIGVRNMFTGKCSVYAYYPTSAPYSDAVACMHASQLAPLEIELHYSSGKWYPTYAIAHNVQPAKNDSKWAWGTQSEYVVVPCP